MIKQNNIIKKVPLILSFVFLFNPNISIIDILPDFVGYILLCCALSKIADLNDYLYEAFNMFKRMIFIDAGKWLAIFWTFNMTVVDQKNSSLLMWTFTFSVLELLFLLPAYKKLFEGITQLGYFIPNKSVLNDEKKNGRLNTARKRTVLFVIAKAALTVLPELADLTNASYDETLGSGIVNLYKYIGVIRLLAFIPMLVIGIIWLVNMIRYFNYLMRDELFMNGVSDKYTKDVLPRKGLFVRRNFHTFLLVAIIAFCLTADFRVEYNNIIPDFLAAGMFAVAFIFIEKHSNSKRKTWIVSTVAYSYMSIISAFCETAFFNEYYYGAIDRSLDAQQLYTVLVTINIVKSLVFLALLFDLYIMVSKMITMHTGYVAGTTHSGEAESKMILSLQKELKTTLIVANISAVVYVISDILHDIFSPKVIFMGTLNFIFAVICVCLFARSFFAIKHAIDTKYMLE